MLIENLEALVSFTCAAFGISNNFGYFRARSAPFLGIFDQPILLIRKFSFAAGSLSSFLIL